MDIPVTVNEYSVSVSVVDESVSVAVTVNTISIDVSVNYGLNLTQINAAIDAKIAEIDIPTKTSELENDSHFITENDIPHKNLRLIPVPIQKTRQTTDKKPDSTEIVKLLLSSIS